MHPDRLYSAATSAAACWAGGSMIAHARRCGCPLCIAQAAALLLDRGRVEMAARVLEGLPAAMVAAVEAAHLKGLEEGRMGTRKPARKPASASALSPTRSHQALAAALAEGRLTIERAAELLKVGTREVEQIAAGRVGLSKSAWQRLLRGLE
jgi:hypothetical protein